MQHKIQANIHNTPSSKPPQTIHHCTFRAI